MLVYMQHIKCVLCDALHRFTYVLLDSVSIVRRFDSPLRLKLEVDRVSASVSVSVPNVDKWALLADIRFRPKAVVPHSVHFRFRRAAVGKFGGCRK